MALIQAIDGELIEPFIPPRLLRIAEDIRAAGGRAFLVGGFVRDTLLGLSDSRDYDVEVFHISNEMLLEILQKFGKPSAVGRAFGVLHLSMRGLAIDFSFPRTESKQGYGHRGFLVETHSDLTFEAAAYRRDFTVNAMGMELPSLEICDPYGGREDLRQKILRHVGKAFSEDSLRVLRGVQFASRFSLTLHPETANLCRTLSLEDLSRERIWEELRKWLLKPGKRSLGLSAFLQMDLLRFFPEIKPFHSSYEMLGSFLDNIAEHLEEFSSTDKAVLMFSALLSGNSNLSEVNQFLSRVTNELKILERVPRLLHYVQTVSPLEEFSDTSIRRLSVSLAGLRTFITYVFSRPDFPEKKLREFSENFKTRAKALGVLESAPTPYLTGKFLLENGLKEGKKIGELIRESFELQLDGVLTSKEGAEIWAKEKIRPKAS